MRLLRVFAAVVPLTALLLGCARAPETPLDPLPTGAPPTTAAQKQVAKHPGKTTDDLGGAEILAAAKKALYQASAVHLVGYFAFDNGGLVALDLRYQGTQGVQGFVKVNGNEVDLIRLGRTVYMRMDEAFLRGLGASAAEARLEGGKYMRFQRPAGRLGTFTTFTDLTATLGPTFTATSLVIKGAHKVIRGVRTVSVAIPHESADTLYVAVTGPPYPMQITPRRRGDDYSLNFVDYGKPVRIAAPPASQVVAVTLPPGE